MPYTRISAWPEVHQRQWCKKFEGINKEEL